MIYTFTLNTAIDRIIYFEEELERKKNNKISHYLYDVGGKATHVSIILSQLGIDNIAAGFIGTEKGGLLKELLKEYNVKSEFIVQEGKTRESFVLVDNSGKGSFMITEKGFTVKLYEDSAVGMNDLKLGRIDAYANTTTNVNAFTHNNTDAKFRFFDEQLLANNVAYFLQKTDDGDKLTKELDDVIQDMLDDGTVAKITEKWMYADMTKLIQK